MRDMLKHPFTVPAAWKAEDLKRDRSWVWRLEGDEIAELEAALDAVKRRGINIPAIRREDFPLPRLAPKLGRMLDELENGRGIVLIQGLPIERYSKPDAGLIYWGIGRYLGRAIAQNAYGDLLGHVRDLGKDWTRDMSARGYQTPMKLPFHNDSCDVVGLMCLSTARSGGESSIVSSVAIHNDILARRPDLAAVLYGTFYVDRRGEEADGALPYYLTPIFNVHRGRMFNRYNRTYIQSAQRFDDVPRLTAEQIEALDLFDALCNDERLRFDMDFMPGDIQLINNYVTLHSRTDYVDWPEAERKRHLLRLWLFTPGLADIPEALKMRYQDMEAWQLNPRPPIYTFEEIMNVTTH